jgi:uncharacterized protein (DUF1697 family)
MANQIINYVAFLRGINVGGKKLIKMEDLRQVFGSLHFQNVRTFIASGNVIFDSAETDRKALTTKIESKLFKAFGHKVPVVLIPVSELQEIVRRSPFKRIKPSADVMMFVALFAEKPSAQAKMSMRSATENLEVLALTDHAAFILCHRKKNGMFAFPNNFFEKEFGVVATTRNWSTVNRVVVFADESC